MNSTKSLVHIIALVAVFLPIAFVNGDEEYGDAVNCYSVTKEIQPLQILNGQTLRNPIEQMFYNQIIKETKCSNEGAKCFDEIYSSSGGEASCVTLYTTVNLYYGDPDSNKVPSAPSIPPIGIGCACKIKGN